MGAICERLLEMQASSIQPAKFRPRIAREIRDYAVMIGLVAAGGGITLVPAGTQCIRLEERQSLPLGYRRFAVLRRGRPPHHGCATRGGVSQLLGNGGRSLRDQRSDGLRA